MILTIIIGVIMFVWTNIRLGARSIEAAMSNLHKPMVWIGTFVCTLFWPIVILWALWEIIRVFKNEIEL